MAQNIILGFLKIWRHQLRPNARYNLLFNSILQFIKFFSYLILCNVYFHACSNDIFYHKDHHDILYKINDPLIIYQNRYTTHYGACSLFEYHHLNVTREYKPSGLLQICWIFRLIPRPPPGWANPRSPPPEPSSVQPGRDTQLVVRAGIVGLKWVWTSCRVESSAGWGCSSL